jgi:hypothetical protein
MGGRSGRVRQQSSSQFDLQRVVANKRRRISMVFMVILYEYYVLWPLRDFYVGLGSESTSHESIGCILRYWGL